MNLGEVIVRAAYAAGVTASALGFGATPGELASVLPEVGDRRAVAAEMAGHRFVNAALTRVIARRGSPALVPLIDWRGAEHVMGPSVLVAWHAGVVGAIGGALRKLERRATVLRTKGSEPAQHITQIVIGRGVAARAAALQKGIEALRRDGLVVMVAEAHGHGASARYSFLGRGAHLPAGPGALVRLGGARLVPITSRVAGQRLVFEAHAPLRFGSDPTAAYAAFFTDHYRAHPGELWPEALRHALQARPRRATQEP